jgi:hypothetical protein
MTMGEVLEVMLAKAKVEAEDAQARDQRIRCRLFLLAGCLMAPEGASVGPQGFV